MQAGTWYQVPSKADDGDYKKLSPQLVDLVRMSVKAHRVNRGNIVWACWQPGTAGAAIRDVQRVNSGAMLIMFTQHGAEQVAMQIAVDVNEKRGHAAMAF